MSKAVLVRGQLQRIEFTLASLNKKGFLEGIKRVIGLYGGLKRPTQC